MCGSARGPYRGFVLSCAALFQSQQQWSIEGSISTCVSLLGSTLAACQFLATRTASDSIDDIRLVAFEPFAAGPCLSLGSVVGGRGLLFIFRCCSDARGTLSQSLARRQICRPPIDRFPCLLFFRLEEHKSSAPRFGVCCSRRRVDETPPGPPLGAGV